VTPRLRRAAPALGTVAGALVAASALLVGCSTSSAVEPRPQTPSPTTTATTATTPSTPTTPTSPSTPPEPRLVVGLGDSVTAGTSCGCTTFVDLYAAGLAKRQHRPVHATNLGRPGLTAVGLDQQLASSAVRGQLAHADTVVVTAGANDLVPLVQTWQSRGCPAACAAPQVVAMGQHLDAALAVLRADLPAGARVLVTNYWNVFQDGDVADQLYGNGFADWSDGVTKAANSVICTAATAAGDECVDIYAPFEGAGDRNPTALLADDGDHPNAAGHRLIAKALLDAS
jgi:lysophospholipase L1-like esterase